MSAVRPPLTKNCSTISCRSLGAGWSCQFLAKPAASLSYASSVARSMGSPFDLGKIRDRAGGGTDFVQKHQAIFAHLGIVVIDLHPLKKRVDRRAQFRHRAHRGGEILFRNSGAGFDLNLYYGVGQRLLFIKAVQGGIRRAVEGPLVLLLLDGEDVAGA